jgi:hypothetical protein
VSGAKPRLGRLIAGKAEAAAANTAARTRKRWHSMTHPHHCAGCGKDYRGIRQLNAHHAARHAGLWSSRAARKAARAMGKQTDNLRRHAMGWRMASKLIDERGHKTERGKTRPGVAGGRVKVRDLREAHRHDRGHEKADRNEDKAARARIPGMADAHREKAGRIREKADARASASQARTRT